MKSRSRRLRPSHSSIEADTPQSDMTARASAAEAPAEAAAEPEIELIEATTEEAPAEAIPEAVLELVDEPASAPAEASASSGSDFELELTPEAVAPQGHGGAATTEDFISELVAELDDLQAPAAEEAHEPAASSSASDTHTHLEQVFAEANATPMAAITPPPTNGSTNKNIAAAPAATPGTLENLNQLHEVFQEFRSELGEMGEEDEDLETHYNLGIAYREMGLLDEAIGEFQKVAKAVQKGKPFRYEMNCSVMLGLSFMDKGEPKGGFAVVSARAAGAGARRGIGAWRCVTIWDWRWNPRGNRMRRWIVSARFTRLTLIIAMWPTALPRCKSIKAHRQHLQFRWCEYERRTSFRLFRTAHRRCESLDCHNSIRDADAILVAAHTSTKADLSDSILGRLNPA